MLALDAGVTNDVVVVDSRRARELLDADEPAELLALVTAKEVALAWCRYAERTIAATPGRVDWSADPDGWAAALYQEDEFWADEDFVRTFLTTIIEAAPNDEVLGWVGAGPLEDFATNEERLLWIEHEAASSRNFRFALANVYPRSSLDKEQNARLREASQRG